MTSYIKIKTLAYGQPRPYADHDYIDVLTFTRDDGRIVQFLEEHNLPLIVPDYVSGEKALVIARVYCPYYDPGQPGDDWAQPHLVSFERLDPTPHGNPTLGPVYGDLSDKWRIHVRSLFTD